MPIDFDAILTPIREGVLRDDLSVEVALAALLALFGDDEQAKAVARAAERVPTREQGLRLLATAASEGLSWLRDTEGDARTILALARYTRLVCCAVNAARGAA